MFLSEHLFISVVPRVPVGVIRLQLHHPGPRRYCVLQVGKNYIKLIAIPFSVKKINI